MKMSKVLSLFLCFVLLAPAVLTTRADALETLNIESKASLLVEANTGEVLHDQNAHEKNFPASITKVMTALVVLEAVDDGRISLDDQVTASETAAALPAGASTAGIKAGDVLTVRELLYCLLIPSANEAGNILAEHVSGSIENFVQEMNDRATSLGCENTHFMNPHGLHHDDHYTTAWDIYLFTSAAMKYDLFMTICGTKSHEVPYVRDGAVQKRTIRTTNALISNWFQTSYLYPDAKGIKTGNTGEAGRCLVSCAERGGRMLVSVVLGAQTVKDAAGNQTIKSFSETIRLFNWGFDNFSKKEILSDSEMVCEVPVTLSSEANYVVAHPDQSITRMMPNDIGPDDLERDIQLNSESLEAPVAAGDELGTLTLSYDGKVYGEAKLLALSDVSASWVLIAQRDALEFLSQTWVKLAAAGVAAAVVAVIVLRAVFSNSRRRYGKRGRAQARRGYNGRKR